MNLKTSILAAAVALTLAVPTAALAQPVYGPGYVRQAEWRRFERERDWRRAEDLRRLRWEDPRLRHDRDFGRGYH